jgi:hypothetical protein
VDTLVIPAESDSVMDFDRGLSRVEPNSCAKVDPDKSGKCMRNRSDKVGYVDETGANV